MVFASSDEYRSVTRKLSLAKLLALPNQDIPLNPVTSTTSASPSQCPLDVPIHVSTAASRGLPIVMTRLVVAN